MIYRHIRAVGVVFLALLSTFVIWGNSVASAASAAPKPSASDKYCVTVLGKPDAATRTAEIVSNICYTGPGAAAKQSSLEVVTASSSYLLISFYDAINYNGGHDEIYGSAPCDSSGYGVKDMSPIHADVRSGLWGGVSSYHVWNNCTSTELFTNTYYGGTASGWRYGDQGYVGSTYNDTFGSMQLRRAS